MLQDYAGPYSPYAPVFDREQTTYASSTMENDAEQYCMHLLYCGDCRQIYKCKIQEWGAL